MLRLARRVDGKHRAIARRMMVRCKWENLMVENIVVMAE